MTRHHGIVDGVLRHAEVIVSRTFHAGELLVGHHSRKNVAACGNFNAVALQIHVSNFEGVTTSPDDENDFPARL